MPVFEESDGFKMKLGSKELNTPYAMKTEHTQKMADSPLFAVESGPIDGGAAYRDTTTDSVEEAQKNIDGADYMSDPDAADKNTGLKDVLLDTLTKDKENIEQTTKETTQEDKSASSGGFI